MDVEICKVNCINDIKEFAYNGTEKYLLRSSDIITMLTWYLKDNMSDVYMAKINGKIEGIAGIFRMYTGVGFVWMLLNKGAKQGIKTIYKCIKTAINNALRIKYWRLQTECYQNDKNIRLLEHLGFKQEAVMRKAGIDGSDIFLYAKIRGE